MIRKRKMCLSQMLCVLILSLSVLYGPHNVLAIRLHDLTPEDERNINDLVSRMTIEEKIGQMLMVGFDGIEANDLVRQLIMKYHVGSIILFERNIKDMVKKKTSDLGVPQSVARLNNSLQKLASTTAHKIPLLIAADQENGTMLRIEKGITLLPSAMAIGATRSEEYAFQAGRITGEELRAMGIQMDLAPVADININKDIDIIGDRSFGGREDLVTSLSVQFLKGLHSGGVLSVAKHFPGHGDSIDDPHSALPEVGYRLEKVERVLMAPYRALVKAGADGIMTAHMEFIKLGLQKNLPISLSKKGLKELVREKLNFDGVLITDDLVGMRAVRSYGRTIKRAARLAAEATNDILIFAHIPYHEGNNDFSFDLGDLEAVIDELKDYFKRNPKQLDQSVRRVLRLKKRVSKKFEFRSWEVDPSMVEKTIRTPEKLEWARRISDASITLVDDAYELFKDSSWPLRKISPNEPMLAVIPKYRVDDFTPQIKKKGYNGLRTVYVKYESQLRGQREREKEIKAKIQEIVNKSFRVQLIIFGMVDKSHAEVLREVREKVEKDIVAIAFHEPNLIDSQLIRKITYLAAYSNLEPSNESVVRVLTGEVRPKETQYLPVSILPGIFDVKDEAAEKIIPRQDFQWWFNKGIAEKKEGKLRAARESFMKAKVKAQSEMEREKARGELKEVEREIIKKDSP